MILKCHAVKKRLGQSMSKRLPRGVIMEKVQLRNTELQGNIRRKIMVGEFWNVDW